MGKEWFKGHYDFGWRNAHKEPGYYGFWSFDTAALAKILGLDDSALNDREEVIRISYVDEHDELCECIYVLEKETV